MSYQGSYNFCFIVEARMTTFYTVATLECHATWHAQDINHI